MNRVARKDAGAVKNSRGNARPVTNSELRVKAQARDSKYGEMNGNLLAKNTGSAKSRKSAQAAGNKGSWETLPATNEVRRTGKSSPDSAQKRGSGKPYGSTGKAPQPGLKQQQGSTVRKASEQSDKTRYVPSGKAPQRCRSNNATQPPGRRHRNPALTGMFPPERNRSRCKSNSVAPLPGTRRRKSALNGTLPPESRHKRRKDSSRTPPAVKP